MSTIKQQVAELKQQGLKPKQVFEKLTEKGVKTTINSIRWYMSRKKDNQ